MKLWRFFLALPRSINGWHLKNFTPNFLTNSNSSSISSILNLVGARMNDTSEMDLQKFGLPEIFIDEAIDLDILSPDYRQKTEELCRSLAVTVR